MQTIKKTAKYILTISSILVLMACNSNIVYNQYFPIKNQQWDSKNTLVFEVNNQDTISKKNVFLNVRNNKSYAFNAIFLITKMESPKGLQITDTLTYEMTNQKGQWLGSGFTDLKENKLLYKENVVFSKKGTYKFSVRHVTRGAKDIEGKNPLQGITHVGLQIEKVQK